MVRVNAATRKEVIPPGPLMPVVGHVNASPYAEFVKSCAAFVRIEPRRSIDVETK